MFLNYLKFVFKNLVKHTLEVLQEIQGYPKTKIGNTVAVREVSMIKSKYIFELVPTNLLGSLSNPILA